MTEPKFKVGDKVKLGRMKGVFEIDKIQVDGCVHLKEDRSNIWTHPNCLKKTHIRKQ